MQRKILPTKKREQPEYDPYKTYIITWIDESGGRHREEFKGNKIIRDKMNECEKKKQLHFIEEKFSEEVLEELRQESKG